MRILIYEDTATDQLSPIALLRPVFELLCGSQSLRSRLQRWFPAADRGVWIRPWLQDAYQEEHPDSTVNDLQWLYQERTLVINGRWLPAEQPDLNSIRSDNAGYIDGNLVWIGLEPEELRLLSEDTFQTTLLQLAGLRRVVEAGGTLCRHPWDLVHQNPQQLVRDFRDAGCSQPPQAEHVVLLGDPRDVNISGQAVLDPFVVLDCRPGPISIERDVHIQSFTRIEGPCYIGRGSQLFRAQIRGGTTIGPDCRAGGEVEASILQGFVNKYHEGFLGHSYVCPWVNLGAMTCTSDLKNDYSSIRVPLSGTLIDTNLDKVGSFIGDHSKTAIDSMFNTGSSIGVMSMVLPAGRLLPRHIPSFCTVGGGAVAAEWPLEASLATARAAMQRRGRLLSTAAERLLRIVHQQTEFERVRALERAMQKPIST